MFANKSSQLKSSKLHSNIMSGVKVPILVTILNLAPTYDIMSGVKVPILVTVLNLAPTYDIMVRC